MSLILEALKKAEKNRPASHAEQNQGVTPATPPEATHKKRFITAAIAFSVIAFGLALLQLITNKSPEKTPVTPSAPLAIKKPVAEPAVKYAQIQPQASAVSVSKTYSNQATGDSQIQSLYRSPPEKKAPPAPSMSTSNRLTDRPSIGWLKELSPQLQNQLPSFRYSAHTYLSPSQGTVTINRQRLKAGDKESKTGLKVVEVLEDGVIFEYSQQTFKQPAMSSWVNR